MQLRYSYHTFTFTLTPSPGRSQKCYFHIVYVNFVCLRLYVVGSVCSALSIPVCYQPVFPLAAPSFVVLQGALHGDFLIGVVSGDVAKPGNLSSFHR